MHTIFLFNSIARDPLKFEGLELSDEGKLPRSVMPWGFTVEMSKIAQNPCKVYIDFDASIFDTDAVHTSIVDWARFVDKLSRHPDLPMERA